MAPEGPAGAGEGDVCGFPLRERLRFRDSFRARRLRRALPARPSMVTCRKALPTYDFRVAFSCPGAFV